MIPFGVYIGQDAELVAVVDRLIAYRRIREQDCLESCLLRRDARSGEYLCAGICRSYPAHTAVNSRPRRWRYAYSGRARTYANDSALSGCLGTPILSVGATGSGAQMRYWDGWAHAVVADETFSMADLHPHAPRATDDNIGECLRCWNMGCLEETVEEGEDAFTGLTVNTPRHMYIFQMTPSSFYCRAARYATCSKGVLFSQNFRQRRGPVPETYMAQDNRVALEPLAANEADFEALACSLVTPEAIARQYLDDRERRVLAHRLGVMGHEKLSQRETARLLGISPSSVARIARRAQTKLFSHLPGAGDEGIYWLVESLTQDRITLRGCQGDVYRWDRPDR